MRRVDKKRTTMELAVEVVVDSSTRDRFFVNVLSVGDIWTHNFFFCNR